MIWVYMMTIYRCIEGNYAWCSGSRDGVYCFSTAVSYQYPGISDELGGKITFTMQLGYVMFLRLSLIMGVYQR